MERLMTYKDIDEAYNKATPRLISIARTYLYNTNYALDCVHEAFEKALVYTRLHPGHQLSDYLLVREVMRAVQRDNKHYSIEVSKGTFENDFSDTEQH